MAKGYKMGQSGGGGLLPRITVNVESGAVVTVTNGTKSYQQTSGGSALAFDVKGYGEWTVSAVKDGETSNTVTVVVDAVKIYEISLIFFTATISVTVDSGSVVTCSKDGAETQTETSAGTVVFTVKEAGSYTISATLDGQTASDTADITTNGQTVEMALAYRHIYGVQWDGTSTTIWSRTDESENFTNPVPAVAGGIGSSPFDKLMPWRGMVRVTDPVAGELVAIPKFWYKWTRSGTTMKLQIATNAVEGFYVSPAHMDRGDGKGERDVIYVGRYHCSADDYKSTTGVLPKNNITRETARTNIHALGEDIWQFDYATLWTIWMLYLVEFGDWHSQNTIGYGCGNNSAVENMGASDSMQYHTGTMQADRTTYGVGCQYRYIEDLWGNVYDWCDGIYFNNSNIYGILNPANYSDTSNGTNIGTRPTSSGYISAYNTPTASGFEWALYPSAVNGSETTYVCDRCHYSSSGVVLYVGGYFGQNRSYGLFFLNGSSAVSHAYAGIGCRLLKLP